jgi:hypothetical protein
MSCVSRFLHNTLIKYSIYETMCNKIYFDYTHSDYKDYYTQKDYEKFSERTQTDLNQALKLQEEKYQHIINNINTYCENYPSDIINHMYFMKDYRDHGYSYKITENFSTILKHIGSDYKPKNETVTAPNN